MDFKENTLVLDFPIKYQGFPCGSDGKESTHNAGDVGLILELGRSPGGEHGNPLQVFFLGESPQRNLAGMGSQRVRLY